MAAESKTRYSFQEFHNVETLEIVIYELLLLEEVMASDSLIGSFGRFHQKYLASKKEFWQIGKIYCASVCVKNAL